MRAFLLTAAVAALLPSTSTADAQPARGWRVGEGVDARTKVNVSSAVLSATRGGMTLVLNCGSKRELRAAFVMKTPSRAKSITVELDKGKPASWFVEARTARGQTLVYVANPSQFVDAIAGAKTMVVRLPQEGEFVIPPNTLAQVKPVLTRCAAGSPGRKA